MGTLEKLGREVWYVSCHRTGNVDFLHRDCSKDTPITPRFEDQGVCFYIGKRRPHVPSPEGGKQAVLMKMRDLTL